MAIKVRISTLNRESESGTAGGSNGAASNVWMDWIDNNCGLDLVGCDESCTTASQRLAAGAVKRPHVPPPSFAHVDYVTLHDELLESLLAEQTRKDPPSAPSVDDFSNSTLSDLSSNANAAGDTNSRKRPRIVRFTRRRSPSHTRPITPPPKLDLSSTSFTTISLSDLAQTSLPPPDHYLHPQCRLQKDKGRGEAVGSSVCAKGRDHCLEKLREKMKLLAEHTLVERKSTATIKRRKARVAEKHANIVETRSLLELRMGFLSMTYGVLLRWDTQHTGKITLIVLRKMCHESFYPLHETPITQPATPLLTHDDREDLEPPFLVHRPTHFEPPRLRINILGASGLSQRSLWTIQLSYADATENYVLAWSHDRSMFLPKPISSPIQKLLKDDELLSFLDIKLFQRAPRRRNRLVTSMRIPLKGLQPQSSKNVTPSRVQLPFSHDNNTSLQLEFLLTSDYWFWAQQEIEARRHDQSRNPAVAMTPIENTVEESDLWEWLICCSC